MNKNYTNKVIQGDAVTMLDNLDRNSIDLFLSDIPYGICLDDWDVLHANTNSALLGMSPANQKAKNGFKRRGKPIRGWSSADRNIAKEYQDWCSSWSVKIYPLMKEGASIFLFAGRRFLPRAIIALEDSGFILRDILAWVKPCAHHRAQSLSNLLQKRNLPELAQEWTGWRLGNLAPKFEPIAWLFKPYKRTIIDNVLDNRLGGMNVAACSVNGKSPTNILEIGFLKGEKTLHEAQKPLELIKYLIQLVTKEGQVVLDPFIGSGTTAVACTILKRQYIGFEISKEYCKIAEHRLQESKFDNSKPKRHEAYSLF